MADTSALQQRIARLKAEYDALQKPYSQTVKEAARLRKERSAAIAAGNYNPEDPVNKQRLQKISDLENEAIIQLENLKRTENQIISLESELKTAQATSASTKENNSGTGTPGTAGEGTDASPEPKPSPTTITGTDPARQAFLDANAEPATFASAPPNIVPSTLTPAQQALLEANQADEGTAQSQKTPSREEQAFLDANAEPESVPQKTISREEQAFLEANQADGPQYEYPPDVSQDAAEDAKFRRQQEQANQPVTSPNPSAKGSAKGLVGKRLNTRKQATAQDNANYKMLKDWRVRLALAPSANYLYKATPPGILAPLSDTDGVVFPYTPTVTTNYLANYDPTELVHSNYKVYQYRSSAVDSISIVGDFTAQDTFEANYLLATIHFFRSITKMFYGQDSDPVNGTPPPLCYLYGYGSFGFDRHPLVITGFTCTFPNDVDYIRATTHNTVPAGTNTSAINVPNASASSQSSRMNGANLQPGAAATPPSFSLAKRTSNNTGGTVEPTYVPTKMQINISATPIVSRNDISRAFSLKKYATGELLQGSKRDGGGIW